ncbi:MAG TPA: MarR family transcriptional regulator [Gemmatimonadaceae bacterium]|nr:MarR family transcriptional regulator [Gemmatimonadaceae bacterium]
MNNSATEQPADSAAGQVLIRLIESGRVLESRIEGALEEDGLSLSKLNVLTLLAEADESLVLSELANRLQCVRSNVTQMMDRLEAEGLVRRLYDATDRRTIRAELTQLGRTKQRDGSRKVAEVNAEIAKSLSPGDVASLARLAGAVK